MKTFGLHLQPAVQN